MPGVKRWNETKIDDGFYEINLSNPKWYFNYILEELLDFKSYIFRGERDSSRSVTSSLDREMIRANKIRTTQSTTTHLNRFKLASRGRIDSISYNQNNDNDWWALGQHHGLFTPMLDWTESPFVSLFFAFEKSKPSTSGYRVVYAISRSILREIKNTKVSKKEDDYIDIINPLTCTNTRLVNQSGLLLSMPAGIDIEQYIRINCDQSTKYYSLIKILIPDRDREKILVYLNKMNINKLTLFPDISGSSEYVNNQLVIKGY